MGAGRGLFVTGTDTGVGKTVVSCALLRAFAARGEKVVGMKPVAAGCNEHGGRWENEDVVALTAASNVPAAPEDVNPYCFRPPIAPHIAAAKAGTEISLDRLAASYESLRRIADRVVVEGAGGLLVPLGSGADFTTLAKRLSLPVLLVVGMRLGCINHALLTAHVLEAQGIVLAGWVANCLEPDMPEFAGNLKALEERLPSPLVGVLPFGPPRPEAAAGLLDLRRMLL